MKGFKVQVSAQAAEDLIEIWADIASNNPVSADRYLMKLQSRIDDLMDLPDRGAPRDNLMKGLRMLVDGKYLIFYRVIKSKVEIVRVIHSSMDIERLFDL